MSCEREQDLVDENNVLEIVYDTFAVEVVHCCAEEVPVERLGESQTARATGHTCYCDHLLETHNLNGRNEHQNIDMTRKQCDEEASDHNKGPSGASDD